MLSLTRARSKLTPSWTWRAAPVPSLLRGFSAPVILKYPYTDERADPSAGARQRRRSTAGKRDSGLALNILLRRRREAQAGRPVPEFPASFAAAFARVLADGAARPGLRRRGARAALRELHRRADGRGRSRRHPCGARSAAPVPCAVAARASCSPPIKPLARAGPLQSRTRARPASARCATCAWAI